MSCPIPHVPPAGHPLLALLAVAAGLVLPQVTRAADRGFDTEPIGNSPLHWAALAGNAREVQRLLAGGADPRATNHAGATPLHYGTGSERVVRLLLQAGADPNARSLAGSTPLHSAAARPGGTAAVRRLLDGGADIEAKRPIFPVGGVTPLGVASGAGPGDEATVALLLHRGAAPAGTPETPRSAGPSSAARPR